MLNIMHNLGLIFEHELLEMEHLFCVCHLNTNLKSVGYKGKSVKDAIWVVVTSTNHTSFEDSMLKIEVMSSGANRYLSDINYALWSKHAFTVGCKSDILLNNPVETFNIWIKEACDKHIITICEEIRRQLLVRFFFFKKKKKRVGRSSYSTCNRVIVSQNL